MIRSAGWFIRSSWKYLGCDRGTGRWRARVRYFRGIVRKTIWFVMQDIRDKRAMGARI